LPADTLVELQQLQSVEDFGRPIAQFRTVFWETRDTESLRKRIRETNLVRDKDVLEIGTGTGLVALCCLQAGARKVVATDVNPSAVACAAYNAEMLGLSDRLELRWVSPKQTDAYSVIGEGERFDLVISNPPWEDHRPRDVAERALYDEGFALLGSLLKDLEKHLKPDGHALLAYGSVDAIKSLGQLAGKYGHRTQVLDERKLSDLPPVFLPGVLIKVTPSGKGSG
jgi:methylase of polypeptide subunit release factors